MIGFFIGFGIGVFCGSVGLLAIAAVLHDNAAYYGRPTTCGRVVDQDRDQD
jgi:hypothetical protein